MKKSLIVFSIFTLLICSNFSMVLANSDLNLSVNDSDDDVLRYKVKDIEEKDDLDVFEDEEKYNDLGEPEYVPNEILDVLEGLPYETVSSEDYPNIDFTLIEILTKDDKQIMRVHFAQPNIKENIDIVKDTTFIFQTNVSLPQEDEVIQLRTIVIYLDDEKYDLNYENDTEDIEYVGDNIIELDLGKDFFPNDFVINENVTIFISVVDDKYFVIDTFKHISLIPIIIGIITAIVLITIISIFILMRRSKNKKPKTKRREKTLTEIFKS